MRPRLSLPMSTETLIPQRPPLRLVDRLLAREKDEGRLEFTVEATNPFLHDDGHLDRLALVEMMAQAYGALKGYERLLDKQPIDKGYLVGLRRAEFKGQARKGDQLVIDVSKEGGIGEFAVIRGEVIRKDSLIASGVLKLWMPAAS